MKSLRALFEKYERYISALSIMGGFAVDSITLERIDLFLANILLIVYLCIVAVAILIVNLHRTGRLHKLSDSTLFWFYLFMQFSFGGLFGRFLVYYSRSGSLYESWPLVFVFAALLVGNEFARKYYARLRVQVAFFYLALFAFLIFYIPLVLGKMGADIFLFSGFVSLALIVMYLRLLGILTPERLRQRKGHLLAIVGGIYLLINALYFANIIPPIPLSLRDAGVYHRASREAGVYELQGEKKTWRDFLMKYQKIHVVEGNPLYVYSAVFAPTDFATEISHSWQYFDEADDIWQEISIVTFPIVGGTDRGYRGYTMKTGIFPGYWRVDVTTARGQVIGRVNFKVKGVENEPSLDILYR